jgi:hypothetical protein
MKSFIITLSLAIGSFFTVAANDGITAPSAVASFKNAYAGATDVSWKITGSLYKVSFQKDGQWASVFYKRDGSLVASARNISSAQLPKALQKDLKEKLKSGWITELFILSTESGDAYYVNIESADAKTVFKSAYDKKWMHYQSMKK